MRIAIVGAGPGGLYAAILLKKAHPDHTITVLERNLPHQTFGWGVVFSDETLGYLEDNDRESYEAITASFFRWNDIEVHYGGQLIRSGGHGFAGIARSRLLHILEDRAADLGVKLVFGTEVEGALPLMREHDLVIAADGVKSRVRSDLESAFQPDLDVRKCRYIWLGTRKHFDAFTFIFEQNQDGLFQVHAYSFDADTSTFIVECDEASFRAAGFAAAGPDAGVPYLERLFARYLDGHPLLTNKSTWLNFATVRNRSWCHDNLVIIGDAAHTAHFSIGSGTKMAMEDAIALAKAVADHGHAADSARAAVLAYEAERRPIIERTQKAAQDSLVWFESVKRYTHFVPLQFAFSLLSRSKRLGYENLATRDPGFASEVTRWFAAQSAAAAGTDVDGATPPMFTPFRLRELTLCNRVVVSPMCMYSADDGTVGDFHLVHLGSRALGGAGLVMTEMTDVSRDGRISPGCAGMYKPEHLAAWQRIVDFVHARSQAKIGMQLGHAGRKGSTRLMWEGRDEPLPDGNWPLISASPLPYLPHGQVPREMNRADMDSVREAYVTATRMADQAGFDLLEIHAAHGYLLASFLSPLTNVRSDEHGGSLENRMRLLLEVCSAVRDAWPAHKPLSVRISASDWVDGGFTCDDAVVVARELKRNGCDIVDVSAGQTTPDARPVFGRMFQTPFSDQIRNEAGIATMTVGNIQSADQINSILCAGRADLCVLARPHLDDPHWTLHAAAALGYEPQAWPPQYGPAKPKRTPPRLG